MSGHQQCRRTGKASLVLIVVLVGAGCLVLGGLCGGGLTMMLVVRPAQQEIERLTADREAAESQAAHLGEAAHAAGDLLHSAASKSLPSNRPAANSKESEAGARTVFENIRAARPQALVKRCSAEFQQASYAKPIAEQLAKYPLPPRTEALGEDLQTLPPIDDNTHQYRYSTKTTEGRPVTFTITMIFGTQGGFGTSEWLLDQLTITETAVEKKPKADSGSP